MDDEPQPAGPRWAEELDLALRSLEDELRAVRRHFHRRPEPSGEEFETIADLAARLKAEGLPGRLARSRRGLVVDAPERSSGPRVAMRADVDALRMNDAKTVEYRSAREGVMHACGHDAHATMALGAAIALHRCRDSLPWPVPWRAIFQPAEESALGAREMVAEGAVEGTKALIALHVDPDRPVGKVGHRVGHFTARCEIVNVKIKGRGGHGARPHETIDPIAAAALFVSSVYQQVPRACDSREPCVLSFGTIKGGEANNVIPDEVAISGTIRSLSKGSSQKVVDVLLRVAAGTSQATGAHVQVDVQFLVDAVVNDPEVTATFAEAARGLLGPENVEPIPLPSMGSEDFAGYLEDVPGCMLRLGVASEGRPRYGLHTSLFDIDESALVVGASLLARGLVLLAGPGR